MPLKIRFTRDTMAGIFITIIGFFFLMFSTTLPIGTASRMGAGYFPVWLSSLLIVLGIIIAAKASFSQRKSNETIYRFDFRRLTILCCSVIVFVFLLPSFGLFVSLSAMLLIASQLTAGRTLKELVLLIGIIDFLVWLIFIFCLQLEVTLWPIF